MKGNQRLVATTNRICLTNTLSLYSETSSLSSVPFKAITPVETLMSNRLSLLVAEKTIEVKKQMKNKCLWSSSLISNTQKGCRDLRSLKTLWDEVIFYMYHRITSYILHEEHLNAAKLPWELLPSTYALRCGLRRGSMQESSRYRIICLFID